MNEPTLYPGERLDDLMRGEMHIIQNPSLFCFGTDAVLLAHFAGVKGSELLCDLGTGVGIMPLLLAARAPLATIDAVEIQAVLCDMASRSVMLNHLEQRIKIHQMDLHDAPKTLGGNRYDCVVCNPPYAKQGASLPNEREEVRIARHEVLCTLGGIIASAAKLLSFGGRLCMIHKTSRMLEVLDQMRAHGLEPKRMQTIHYDASHPAKIFMVEAKKGGRSGLAFLPPMLMYDLQGQETAELQSIYQE